MTARKNRLSFILFISLLSLFLSGCGNLGTGVVLWAPEESRWNPGDTLTVKDESFLRNTYIVNLPGQRRLKEEIDQWRVRLFHREKDALAWAETMGEWKNVYAECLYQGLPMRSEPSNTASRLYRFREGDFIKVLGREPGPVEVGNLEGYWYRVLADGGVEGYVFDYHLRVMEISSEGREILNARNTDDPILDTFLSDAWRPDYFATMVEENSIDLKLFRPEFGLFPDGEENTMYLRLPDLELSETWTEIVPAGPDRYDFLGTSFRVTVNSEWFASVQYNDGETERFEAFIRLGRDIDGVIAAEIQRRNDVLEDLWVNGPVYGSRAYGELAILEDGTFAWSGKSSLISRGLISSGAGNKGVIEFDHFINPSIALAHKGVLSLRFDNGEVLRFLYSYENDGLQLLYVPLNAIDKRQVRTDQYIDPIRIFFAPIGPGASEDGVVLPDR